jgi:hypothetical protein
MAVKVKPISEDDKAVAQVAATLLGERLKGRPDAVSEPDRMTQDVIRWGVTVARLLVAEAQAQAQVASE